MSEAMVLEDSGAYEINLVPSSCHIRKSRHADEANTWLLWINSYRVGTNVCIYFYLDQADELEFAHAQENGRDHKLTTEELETLEEVFAWLQLAGHFEDDNDDNRGESHGSAQTQEPKTSH